MSFIEKFKNKFFYNFIVGVVTVHLFCGGSYSAVPTDDELIVHMKEQYKGFGGLTIVGAEQPVHHLLQFAWSLSASNDQYAQRKVVLIISGRVWRVDPNCSANEDERGVYLTLIGAAKAKGASRAAFTPSNSDAKTVERSHQLYLAMAYEVIAVTAAGATGAPPFINYVTDRRAFRVATRDVSVH
jgi:hypothetical protein